jgi:hypothetical protein
MGYFLSFSLSKPATETLLDVSEIILIGAGLILTVGAIGEYLEEHGRLPRWIAWPRVVFIIMVVAGLLGEFFSDAGVFVFSRHLQTIADLEIAHLEASNVGLRKDFADAQKETALAIDRAAAADLARVKLEASMEWRKLSKEQEIKLCSELGPQLAKKYHVNAIFGDMEAESYAVSIGDALDRCEMSGGITPSTNPPHWGFSGRWKPHERPLWGVWVTYSPIPTTGHFGKAEAIVLRDKLRASGIKVSGITDDPEGVLPLGIIFVGPRPPPNAAYILPPAYVPSGGPLM